MRVPARDFRERAETRFSIPPRRPPGSRPSRSPWHATAHAGCARKMIAQAAVSIAASIASQTIIATLPGMGMTRSDREAVGWNGVFWRQLRAGAEANAPARHGSNSLRGPYKSRALSKQRPRETFQRAAIGRGG